MSTDGGGWMLVSKSYPDASSSSAHGVGMPMLVEDWKNFGEPYNIGYYTTFFGTGLR